MSEKLDKLRKLGQKVKDLATYLYIEYHQLTMAALLVALLVLVNSFRTAGGS